MNGIFKKKEPRKISKDRKYNVSGGKHSRQIEQLSDVAGMKGEHAETTNTAQ